MGVKAFTLLVVLCYASALPFPQRPTRQLTERDILDMFSSSTKTKTAINSEEPRITSIHVKSDIENRYAHTLVKSRVINPANYTQEVFFTIIMPEKAFITAFSMEIDGKMYKAYIKEKAKAKEQYEEAVKKGQAAAHVQQTARDSDRFTTSVNVKPMQKVTFFLHYEELLVRDLGLYNHVITLNPGNIVPELKLDVHIKEQSEVKDLFVNNIQSANEINPDVKENPKAQVEYINPNEVNVHVTVDEEEQKKLISLNSEDGAAGQLTVKYNVAPQSPNGDIIVDSNGFFVHFFAPANETTQKKHVLFVLDTSGSMHGKKIQQLKKAMEVILDELNPDDIFNIIEFSSSVTVRNLDGQAYSAVYHPFALPYGEPAEDGNNVDPFPATPEYKKKAKDIINRMTADGGTNIQDALKTTLNIAKKATQPEILGPVEYTIPGPGEPEEKPKTNIEPGKFQPIIMFLTDGDPTVGETNFNDILQNIQTKNSQQVRIFSLAFGDDANFGFLKNLSSVNFGSAKKIYEASDAAIQLNHFYKHISALILRDIKFIYPPDQIVDNRITKREFNNLFKGSEIVVAGRINPKLRKYEIEGATADGIKKYEITIPEAASQPYGPLERLYAYMTISQLLDEGYKPVDDVKPEEVALSLAKRDYWTQFKSFIEFLIAWIQFMIGFIQGLLSDDYIYVDTAPSAVIENPSETALKLALQYSFVCPLTSLVVVKPDGDSAQEPEKASPTAEAESQPMFAASPKRKYSMLGNRLYVPHSPGAPGSISKRIFAAAYQPSYSAPPVATYDLSMPPLPSFGGFGFNRGIQIQTSNMMSMPMPSRFDNFNMHGLDFGTDIVEHSFPESDSESIPTTSTTTTTTTTTVPPETTAATLEPTAATPEPTAATPEPTAATSEPTTATLEPTAATSEPTTIPEAITEPQTTVASSTPETSTVQQTTTILPETTTTQFAVKHLAQIPWLPALRNGNKLKIYTPEGYKNLILSPPPKDLNDTQPCRVEDNVGVCRPLYACISETVKQSVQDYIEHICDLPGDYAGVCCLPGVPVTDTVQPEDDNNTTEPVTTASIPETTEASDETIEDVTEASSEETVSTAASTPETTSKTPE